MQDLAEETAAIASTFRLPWNAAANWMNQRGGSPPAKVAVYPGEWAGRAAISSLHAALCCEDGGVLVARHIALLNFACPASCPTAASMAPDSPGTGEAAPKSASLCTAASLDGSPTQAASGSLEGGGSDSGGASWAQLAECDSEDALLAEASSFGGSDAVTGGWVDLSCAAAAGAVGGVGWGSRLERRWGMMTSLPTACLSLR